MAFLTECGGSVALLTSDTSPRMSISSTRSSSGRLSPSPIFRVDRHSWPDRTVTVEALDREASDGQGLTEPIVASNLWAVRHSTRVNDDGTSSCRCLPPSCSKLPLTGRGLGGRWGRRHANQVPARKDPVGGVRTPPSPRRERKIVGPGMRRTPPVMSSPPSGSDASS